MTAPAQETQHAHGIVAVDGFFQDAIAYYDRCVGADDNAIGIDSHGASFFLRQALHERGRIFIFGPNLGNVRRDDGKLVTGRGKNFTPARRLRR